MSEEDSPKSNAARRSLDGAEPVRRSRGGRVLRTLRWTAVGALCLLLAASVVGATATIFVRDQLLSTDNFTERAVHLAEDPAVQAEVTDLIMAEINAALDVESMSDEAQDWLDEEDVPEDVEAVLGSAASGLYDHLESEVQEFVGSPDFVQAWTAAVRTAHSELVQILDRGQGEVLTNADSAVSVELGPIVALAKAELLDSGFELAAEIPEVDTQVQLADSDLVPAAQEYTQLLRTAAAWLPWVGLASLALLTLMAPRRPHAVAVAGGVVGVAASAAAATLWLLRDRYVAEVDDAVMSAAVGVFTAGFIPQFVVTALIALAAGVICLVLSRLWRRRRTVDPTADMTEMTRPALGD